MKESRENSKAAEKRPVKPQERRGAHRYTPVRDSIRLGWWEGAEFQTASAQLTDLSNGGAALLAEFPVVETASFWISIAGAGGPGWVAANLVAVEETALGSDRLRLAFVETCPYDFFKQAVWGATPSPNTPAAPSPAAPAPASCEPQSASSDGPEPSPAPQAEPNDSDWVSIEVARMDQAEPRPSLPGPQATDPRLAASLPWGVKAALNLIVALLVIVLVASQLSTLHITEHLAAVLGR